ncbi:hypothetical protein HDU76_008392 [Blyttiomyces sp. JEL0837]|nr:hypothetical protein HDU76_008392 [Blyttiomyces sp. JEL0837]
MTTSKNNNGTGTANNNNSTGSSGYHHQYTPVPQYSEHDPLQQQQQQQQQQPVIVVVNGRPPVIVQEKRRRYGCCKYFLIFLTIFLLWQWFDGPVTIWHGRYSYPTAGLDPKFEFESPIRCLPHEASNHVYLKTVSLPSTAESFKYEVYGRVSGIIKAETSSEVSEITIESHLHLSNPNQKYTFEPSSNSNNPTIKFTTSNEDSSNHCTILAANIKFPLSMSQSQIKKLLVSLVSARYENGGVIGGGGLFEGGSLDVVVDLQGLDGIGGLDVATGSGSVKVRNLREVGSGGVKLVARSGSVSVSDVNAPFITTTASSGSISIDAITTKSLTTTSSSGSVKIYNAIVSESINTVASSGSIKISNLSGSFSTFHTTASSGSVRISDTVLDLTKFVDVGVKSSSGSCRVELENFYGAFTLSSTSGSVKVNGDHVRISTTSKKQVSGYRYGSGSDSDWNKHKLNVEASSGSVSVGFLG